MPNKKISRFLGQIDINMIVKNRGHIVDYFRHDLFREKVAFGYFFLEGFEVKLLCGGIHPQKAPCPHIGRFMTNIHVFFLIKIRILAFILYIDIG
jgi:hypothetical protein